MSTFDEDVDLIKRMIRNERYFLPSLGPAQELTVKRAIPTRSDVIGAIVVICAGLPISLTLRAIGM